MSSETRIAGGDTDPCGPLSLGEAQKIVQDYLSILHNSAPLLGWVADVCGLPYTKPVIKDAIVACMADCSDSTTWNRLRTAYLALADWQEGVGERQVGLSLLKPHPGEAFLDTHPSLVTQRPASSDGWNIKVVDERQQLANELKALGLKAP